MVALNAVKVKFFYLLSRRLIVNILRHLAQNYAVQQRLRYSVLREKQMKGEEGVDDCPLQSLHRRLHTVPWPCEPLYLFRQVMSWNLHTRFIHNHRKKDTRLLAQRIHYIKSLQVNLDHVSSLMDIECQQPACLAIWSLEPWLCGHQENEMWLWASKILIWV